MLPDRSGRLAPPRAKHGNVPLGHLTTEGARPIAGGVSAGCDGAQVCAPCDGWRRGMEAKILVDAPISLLDNSDGLSGKFNSSIHPPLVV